MHCDNKDCLDFQIKTKMNSNINNSIKIKIRISITKIFNNNKIMYIINNKNIINKTLIICIIEYNFKFKLFIF